MVWLLDDDVVASAGINPTESGNGS